MSEVMTPERALCDAAREYLLEFRSQGVTSEVLEQYMEPRVRAAKLSDVYWQLLWSSQNANMRTGVITGSMDGGMMALADVLQGFQPALVARQYGENWEAVLDDIVEKVGPRGQIRRTRRSIWPQFCRSIVSGAEFLTQFSDAEAFYAWADGFGGDVRSRLDLPVVIAENVSGLGFALSCDFLKELGYSAYGKPDVHIRKTLAGLGLARAEASDREVLELLVRFADSAGLSAYRVDKLMWLIGSGSFYQHGEIGHVPTNLDQFVTSERHLFSQQSQ